ncbi:MAG: MBL fold metallo-hydrolase, partial [Lachnospiraceae bacterium]|nr:MBL fold metallo-hydrolase [Lachnospiraceae bacterium]
MKTYPEITINAHSSIRIAGSKVLYFDPFQLKDAPHDADVVFLTHSHFDHESPEDLEKVSKPGTQVVRYEEAEIPGLTVRTVPAYNPNKKFHPKENHWVGYLVTMDGVTVTNWSQITDAIAAVSSALIAHTSATNPHGITAEGIGALTNETDAVALAALVPVEARVGALEAYHEWPDTCRLYWPVAYMLDDTNHVSSVFEITTNGTEVVTNVLSAVATVPTNFPTRKLWLEISDFHIPELVVRIPGDWNPGRDVEITLHAFRQGTDARNTSFVIGNSVAYMSYTAGNQYRFCTFSFDAASGVWSASPQSMQTRGSWYFGGSKNNWPTALPLTVGKWMEAVT